jgi:hypothetical protein
MRSETRFEQAPGVKTAGLHRDREVPTQLRKPLPKSRSLGALVEQWKRCGKSGCRCTQGRLHGPYFAVMTRQNGRLHKRYVRLADVAVLRALLDVDRRQRLGQREVARAWRRAWSATAQQLREQFYDA